MARNTEPDFYFGTNSTTPDMQVTVTDANGTAIDVTSGTVAYYWRSQVIGSSWATGAGSVVNGPSGIVKYTVAGTEAFITTAGEYFVHVKVTVGGEVIPVPTDGYFSLKNTTAAA